MVTDKSMKGYSRKMCTGHSAKCDGNSIIKDINEYAMYVYIISWLEIKNRSIHPVVQDDHTFPCQLRFKRWFPT